jgi:hypothetical protein
MEQWLVPSGIWLQDSGDQSTDSGAAGGAKRKWPKVPENARK